jgi:hypothetical protein
MTAQTIVLTQLLSRMTSFNQDRHLEARRIIFKELSEEPGAQINGPIEDDLGEIASEIEMLGVSDTTELRTRNTVHRGILRGLHYATMSDRYEELPEAHTETFEWAFHNSTAEQETWDNLSGWLKADGGIYWVSGKADSGKSTFMKHIYDDFRTRKYLKESGKDVPLCVATFFFWNSGSKEQKTQSGLLHALLFQILEKHPELGSVAFPATWAKLYSSAVSPSWIPGGHSDTESWSLK